MAAFWIATAILTVISTAMLLWPLWRRSRSVAGEGEGAHDLAVYRDQLAEIAREVERGVLAPNEAEAASIEIKRRALRVVDRQDASGDPPSKARKSAQLLAALLLLGVPVAAVSLYATLGSPGLSDKPFAARIVSSPSSGERAATPGRQAGNSDTAEARKTLDEAVTALARHLAANPNDARGWLLLGRAYLTNERYDDAVEALRRANDLVEGQPEVAAAYGEALVMAADGRVTDQAQHIFEEAFAKDPRNPQARYFLGLRRAQAGDLPGALQDWVDLVALSPKDAPWLPSVIQQIAAVASTLGVDPARLKPRAETDALVAPTPAFPNGAASDETSPEQRQTMIRAMVERLANRLEQNPNDPDGWLRLARAYDVLGEKAKADQARARAQALASPSIR